MNTNVVSGHNPVVDPASGHPRMARWSVAIAAVAAVVMAVSYAIFGVAFATGGDDAVSDNWVGLLGAVALVGGLATSFVAFILAAVAKARHEHWKLLWLPLLLFPGLLVVVLVVEAFWME